MGHEASHRALRDALGLLVVSRVLVLGVGVFAAIAFEGDAAVRERVFDVPGLTHPFGAALDLVASPLARWDSIWYLSIASGGYDEGSGQAAFFPLYPMLVRTLGLFGSSAGAMLIAAYAISLAAFGGALYLIHRLVTLELGERFARPVVALVAFYPASVYFGAPYAESLFLLLSVGAFYAARTGNWDWAGICAGLASATRSAGVLLLIPLALLYLYGPRVGGRPAAAGGRLRAPQRVRPRFRVERDALWLALAPAGLVAYAVYLWLQAGDPLEFTELQQLWHRDFAGPLGGVWDATVAAFDGLRQLASGDREPVYFEQAGGDPFRVAGYNLLLYGFLVGALVALVGAFRRLPPAYGAWAAVALALPLSFPVEPQPLQSFPRYISVLFPLFMWLGLWVQERRWTDHVVPAFAVGLGMYAAGFATWQRLV